MFDLSLLVFVALVIATAATGVLFQPGAWYERLAKPSWTPPNWLFGPVWSVLYIMIAVAGWLVWSAEGAGLAIALWACQLVLNGLWSFQFFGIRRMDLAMVDVTLLWRFVQSMDTDYVATIQLLDDAGELVAQADGDVPGYPTSYWRAAPPFPDARTLAIPPDTPPGTYRLWVGWYRLPDGARLPVIADGAVNDLAPLPVTLTVGGG